MSRGCLQLATACLLLAAAHSVFARDVPAEPIGGIGLDHGPLRVPRLTFDASNPGGVGRTLKAEAEKKPDAQPKPISAGAAASKPAPAAADKQAAPQQAADKQKAQAQAAALAAAAAFLDGPRKFCAAGPTHAGVRWNAGCVYAHAGATCNGIVQAKGAHCEGRGGGIASVTCEDGGKWGEVATIC